jgi:acyl-CoA reductase-like NAD-dependent aldehyde dehydrogenase
MPRKYQRERGEYCGRYSDGGVGQIIPWNFPLLMLAWKIATALGTAATQSFSSRANIPLFPSKAAKTLTFYRTVRHFCSHNVCKLIGLF